MASRARSLRYAVIERRWVSCIVFLKIVPVLCISAGSYQSVAKRLTMHSELTVVAKSVEEAGTLEKTPAI